MIDILSVMIVILSLIILGLIIAVFLYKKSRRAAQPSFQKASLGLIGKDENNLPDEVTVLFKERKVDRLTKTILILWNNGNEVLKGEDIVAQDQIKISFNEGDHILSYKKLRETNAVNEFSVSKDKDNSHQLLIEFSYLNPRDGISLELLHDSEDLYPKVQGSIMGLDGFEDLGELEADDVMPFTLLERILNRRIVYWIVGVIGLMFIVAGLPPQNLPDWVTLCLGLLFSATLVGLLVGKKRYPKSLEITETG